jgi:O-antigen/teichoic acid export membrane protein
MTQELLCEEGTSPPVAPAMAVSTSFLVRLARGAIVALTIQVLGAGLTYLSQVAFARWMGITQFGVYTYLIAWTTVVSLLAGLGFPMSVLRFIPEYRALDDNARLRGVVRISRGATLAVALAVAVIGTPVVAVLASGKTATAAEIAIWLVPVGALINLDTSIIRAGGRVLGAYGPSLVLRPLVILLASAGVWLAWGRLTAGTGLAITLGVFAGVALLQSWLVREITPRASSQRPAVYQPRIWLRVSAPLLLVAGFQIALSQTDLIVVGAAGGVRNAALYRAASQTATLVGYLLVAFSAVGAPLFAEFEARGDRAGLQHVATVSVQWIFWPSLLLALGLAALAIPILELFGTPFVAARWTLVVLLLGQLVSVGCGAVGYLLGMTGYQNDLARVYGITALFNVALCYVGVRAFGLVGAAWATTFSLIAWNVWLHQLTTKRLGIRASILSAHLPKKASRA